MQVEHLFSYNLYHELWNQNLINEEGFIIADTHDLKRYKTYLEERSILRGAETHKNRKRILDKTQELLKFESLTASQEEDLHALLQRLQLDVSEEGFFVLGPDVEPPKKKYPGVPEPSLSLWELKIDEAVRAKKIQRRDLRTLDKWLGLIVDSKAKVRKVASCETAYWKELEKKCRKRTKDRLNEMEMKRRNKINSFHADNDYAWKNMCGMKVSPKKVSKGKSLETMSPLRQAAPHILAPPKSAIDRGFLAPKKESVERDDISKDPSFMQKASETAENLDAPFRLPKVFEKEKTFAFGDHVDLSLAERKARKAEKIRMRLKLFQRIIARKTADQQEIKGKKQQKLDKTYFLVDKREISSRESETSLKKDLRKVKERRKRDAISVREDREISGDEKGVWHEEEILRKSEKFETPIKSERGQWRQDVVEDKMTSKVKLSEGRRESLVISETLSDILNLVELNADGELKELKVEGIRNLKQSLPVVSGILTLEEAELLKDMSCSVEINKEDANKSENLLLSDATKASIPRTYEEGKDDINETTRENIEDNLEVIGIFDDLLLAASEEPTRCHLDDINKLADAAGRDDINESTRETIEANLDVIETFDDLLNSITSEEHTRDRFEDADQLTDSEGRYEVNESVCETIQNNLDVIETADDLLNSITSEEPTKGHLEDTDILMDAERRYEVNESVRETMETNLDVIRTFDKLLNSITSGEPTKGHLEDTDQLMDSERRYEVNESVRETVVDNLDVIGTSEEFLDSISSEEPTGCHLESFDKLADAAGRDEINESTRETMETNLDVIRTFDKLLNSITSEEPTKGHLEDTDQLMDSERRYEVNESVRETVVDNLDVIGTSDEFRDSISSEEPTGCHLESFDKLADAAGRDKLNEFTRGTMETNLDVIRTFDDLLNSITSEEPTKGHLEDTDQLMDAERRYEVQKSVRETVEDNLDVIGTSDEFLDSISSEEPTGCHLESFDKLTDAAERDEINEFTRETMETNLDVIRTFDDLLNSITSDEPTKGHLEDTDQLMDAERRYEVNESVRETVEDNLDVMGTSHEFLDSIASEEPTLCHLESFDKLTDAAGRDEINESTRETMETNLDVIRTFDDLLNSMTSEESTKGHLEDTDQLMDAERRYEVKEFVHETVEDNLDVIGTSDEFLDSIASEEPTLCHLESFDKLADAAGRDEINESTRETMETNLDVIRTFDDLLNSVTSEETTKGHLEHADQLMDAERRYEVNESVRETVEDNLDVIRTCFDFLDSIESEEPTGCHSGNFDKLADAAGRDEINESTRETMETNLDVIETFDDLRNSIRSKEPTKGHFEDSDQLTDAGERYEANESVRETTEDNFDAVETFDNLLNSVTSEETTKVHFEDADQLIDAERRYEESESVGETIEDILDVIETFDDSLNSIRSKEPTKGHFEDSDQLTDAGGRYEVDESVRETTEDNLDAVETFDDLLKSVTSEETTKVHLEDAGQLIDAERRYEESESVGETFEDNLDVIETFGDLLHSIRSKEPTKGHFENADQLTDAEGRDEVNESARETIEEKLDLIDTFDDVLNSMASEEPTECYLEGADKWKSTERDISVQQNTEDLVKYLVKDITDKLIETDLYSLHSESGEDLIDFDEEHRTEKWMEQVTDLEACEELADAKFIRASRIADESKSFENEFPTGELLPKLCTFDEILTKCVSPIKYTNTKEESLHNIESLRLKGTDIEEAGLQIQEKKYPSEVLEVDISESTSRKLLTQKSIELEGVQLIKARLALSKKLETPPFVEYKPNICTIDEISEQCGSPSKLENIAEVPFRDVHSVREEAPFDLLRRETEGYTAEIPVEDILEATSQLITKESDAMKAISSSPKDIQSGVKSEFEEVYLGVSTFSRLRRQEDTKRKSVEQNLLVLDPRTHEVPISISEIPQVKTDDRKRDRYHTQKYSDDYSRDDSDVKIRGVEDSNLPGRSAKAGPSRSQLHRGFRDSLRQNSLEKIKEKRLTLSSSRDEEHSRRISLKESDTSEDIPNYYECFQTIGEKLKNAERKLSVLAIKTGTSPQVLNGKQQKSRRSTILPSRSKTKLSEQEKKTRGSISEKDQDQKPISSISKEMKPEQGRYFKEDKQIQAHPSTSGERPSEKKDDSEPKPDGTTQEGKKKRKWPAFIKVNTQNIADISSAILERTRALKANKGLILNKSLFSTLDESKFIKKDK